MIEDIFRIGPKNPIDQRIQYETHFNLFTNQFFLLMNYFLIKSIFQKLGAFELKKKSLFKYLYLFYLYLL